MQYLGGKFMVRKQLTEAIRARVGDARIWEPFCGGLNLSGRLKPAICSDADLAVISLYQAVQAGWDPPDTVTEDDYQAARQLPETDPMHGFCAFGCSFGGKKWGCYARGKNGRNYAGMARRALLRDVDRDTIYRRLDYLTELPSEPFDAIYCDPPYVGTTGYSGSKFDHAAFWDRCRELSERGPVLVSEYTAPDDWREIWSIERVGGLTCRRTERLFACG